MKKIKYILGKIKWYSKNFYLKKEHKITPIINFIILVFKLVISLISFVYILCSINVITIYNKFLIHLNIINYNNIHSELVITQISCTFLTTAILSLISSIENKHILGEKETDLLFGKKIQGFYIPMFVLYVTMIINIIFMLNETSANILIILFLTSIYTLIYIIGKIGAIFLTTKKYIKILYYKYYKEAETNIINNVLPKDYENKLLFNLKENTISLIAENNLSYIKNINMYRVIIDRLLFNIPKQTQKYHLNMNYAPSIINDFIEIIEHFLYFDETIRAIQCYDWLLSRLNYHNIYLPYNNLDHIIDELINKIADLKNEYAVKNYLSRLSSIITDIEIQEHYAFTNNYKEVELSPLKLDYIYHHSSNYFAKTYDKIFANKYLNNKEKINCYTALYEMFRMSAHDGCNIISDITNYSFDYIAPKKREMNPCIIGQATALLLLQTLKNKDDRSFKLFLGMNIEGNELSFAIHCTILSLININFNRMDSNIYSDYYGIDVAYCKKIINKEIDNIFTRINLYQKQKLKDQLQYDYDYIIKTCVKKQEKNNLFLEYIFKFEETLVNQYFDELGKKYNIKIKTVAKKNINYKKKINEYITNNIEN